MPSAPSTESPAPRSRVRRWARKTFTIAAFGGALLVTAAFGFYAVEKALGRAQWRKYESAARQRGVKLSLEEYVPAPVPEAENFAAIPLFEETFRAARERHAPTNPFSLPWSAQQKPATIDLVKGKTLDLAAWQQFFLKAKVLGAATGEPAHDVLAVLEKYAPSLEQLHEAGRRPGCRFPVRWEDGINAALPHLDLIQSAARLYTLRLGARLATGQSAAACEDFHDTLRLYRALENEPSLISGLVRVSVLSMLEGAVWDGLVKKQWQAAELRGMCTDLESLPLAADYRLALGSERGFSNLIYQQLQNNQERTRDILASVEGLPTSDSASRLWMGRLLDWYPRGWMYRCQERTNRYYDEMLERVSSEPPRIYPERRVDGLAGMHGDFEKIPYTLFYLMMPALEDIEHGYARTQTWHDETRLGCALELYRQSEGRYPASLEALVPGYVPALPADVMNGEPLHYRVEADGGYVIYSVGWNLKDDGGKLDPKLNAKRQLDWVWKMPATAQPWFP